MAPTPTRPKLTVQIPQTPLLSTRSPTPHAPLSLLTPPPTPIPSPTTTPTAPTAPTSAHPSPPLFPFLPRRHPCLQCRLLSLRCSFTTPAHILPPRVPRHAALARPDEHACVRCKRNGVEFCILQTAVAAAGDLHEGEYIAQGVESRVLRETVRELLEVERGRVRCALPMVSDHHKRILKAVKLRWEGKEEEGEQGEDLEGLKERERHLEVILNKED